MTLQYDEIFSNFLGYITDYNIVSMDTVEAYSLMAEWLHKAYSKPYVRRLFSSATMDDDIQEISFDLGKPVEKEFDKEFVINILAKGMVVEWLKPQVNSKNLTAQMFSGKEQKFFSQAQHLSELQSLLENVQLEQKKIIRDRGYIYNPYLEG